MLASAPYPRRLSLPFSPRARVQLLIFGLAYLLYSAARFVTIGDLPSAREHADWIVGVERSSGTLVEASVQQAFDGTWMLWVLNHLYLIAQLGVIPLTLVFLYRRAPKVYATLRNTILATWLISIPVYALFPVAPPRLASMGIVDTITRQTGFALDSSLTTSFYNELAAVPSLHVGFAVAVSLALFAAVKNPWLRALALLWGPLIGLSVVATGNHFVFDIAAGVAASAAGYVMGGAARIVAKRRRQSADGTRRPSRVLAEA